MDPKHARSHASKSCQRVSNPLPPLMVRTRHQTRSISPKVPTPNTTMEKGSQKKKSAIVLKETLHWPIIAKIPVSESSYKKERDHVLHFWHLGGRSISESDGWQGDKVHGCEAKEKDIWPKTISLSPCRQSHAHQKPCYPTPWHGFRYISFACLLQIILEKYLWPFRVSGTS